MLPLEVMTPEPLDALLERVAALEPTSAPLLSLYVDARPDQRGKDHFGPVVKKELADLRRTWDLRSPGHESVERDVERIERYLQNEVDAAANGLVIFACDADGVFETIQLAPPVGPTFLAVTDVPYVFPLARLRDRYPSCAVLTADRKDARLFVFALGARAASAQVTEETIVPRPTTGGWSQMHFQRHADEHRLEHVRDSIDALVRLVAAHGVEHVLLAGDDVVGPLLEKELPPALAAITIGVVPSEMRSSDEEIQRAAEEAVRSREQGLDVERVRALLDAYHGGGLAIVGSTRTLAALERGQVHELLVSAPLDGEGALPRDVASPGSDPFAGADGEGRRAIANALVLAALRTAARVRCIEDPGLLAAVGGVGALLRYQS